MKQQSLSSKLPNTFQGLLYQLHSTNLPQLLGMSQPQLQIQSMSQHQLLLLSMNLLQFKAIDPNQLRHLDMNSPLPLLLHMKLLPLLPLPTRLL